MTTTNNKAHNFVSLATCYYRLDLVRERCRKPYIMSPHQYSTEEQELFKELDLTPNELDDVYKKQPMSPLVIGGFTAFFIANAAMLLSLPPVLRGKGAPYLPTWKKSMDTMFQQLRNEPRFTSLVNDKKKLTFVDLGSGDGRVVFRAAQTRLFAQNIGYEINPILHILASTALYARRALSIFQSPEKQYYSTISFYRHDLWKTDLTKVNVVAVYGLGPIMTELGHRLEQELPPNSFVISNVFTFPNWKVKSSVGGTHLYVTPDCWRKD